MLRRVLIPLAAGCVLSLATATAAFAGEPADLMPLCDEIQGHSCGSTVDDADGHILGEHVGHSIGNTLDAGDVDTILELAADMSSSDAPKASDLLPLCDDIGKGCGSTIDDADGRMLGEYYGHGIGNTLDPGDVESILDLAKNVGAAGAPIRHADWTVWDDLAQCEAGGNWASTAGTYEGGLQFHPATWDGYRPSSYPDAAYEASREQQIEVGERVQADQGWDAWPHCSRKLGLR